MKSGEQTCRRWEIVTCDLARPLRRKEEAAESGS
jgi:hypothetical protein